MRARSFRNGTLIAASIFSIACLSFSTLAQTAAKSFPWSASALSPGERANLALKEMTLDEKIALVDGHGMIGERNSAAANDAGDGDPWR